MRAMAWLGAVFAVLVATPAVAQQDVPSALRDWQGWVLHDVPDHACPLLNGGAGDAHQCVWPGQLALDVGATGARFDLDVRVDAPAWVALPGGALAWPQQVTDAGHPLAVLNHDGAPAVHLDPGNYRLQGTLQWSERPPRLAVPTSIALLKLSVDGKPVTRIERHGGALTLGEGSGPAHVADALSVRVFRKLGDGIPARLATRIELDVSGRAREVDLGPVLPAGFAATMLDGSLAAELKPDGTLAVQLRPGRWQLELDARARAPLTTVAPPKAAAPWPAREVWSFADAPIIRQAKVDGQAVDPAQAGVPDDWRSLPAFAVTADAGLAIATASRGLDPHNAVKLKLDRQLWLDYSGDGLTAVDSLSGELAIAARLDVAAPWQLESATVAGRSLPIGRVDGRSGVELDRGDLHLRAMLRVPSGGAVPASGWNATINGINAELHLPPGYRLMAAPGVDSASGSWVARWNVLDLFLVAVIALLAGRVLGWPLAAVAAGYLVLAHGESDAPRWIVLLALGLIAFARALPAARLRVLVRYFAAGAVAVAVLVALPFAMAQLRLAVWPQLDINHHAHVASVNPTPAPSRKRAMKPRPAAPPVVTDERSVMALPAPAPTAPPPELAAPAPTRPAYAPPRQSLPPDLPLQAGPGTPAWDEGNNYQLRWSGPVTPQQSARLLIAPAWLVRIARIAMVLLLAGLLAKMLRSMLAGGVAGKRWQLGAVGLLGLLVMVPITASAQSSLPSPELLKQLRTRLTEAPKCAPDCAAIARADLAVDGNGMRMTLTVAAGADLALPLPQATGKALTLEAVRVDGAATTALVRGAGRQLVRVGRGTHTVALVWAVTGDHIGLRFPLRAQQIRVAAPGWTVEGVEHGRLEADSVNLHRNATPAGATGAPMPAAQTFPPYVRVQRAFQFGTVWTVRNVVRRIAPARDGFSVQLPLLAGEHPLGDGLDVDHGRITVSFRAGQATATWTSRLDPRTALKLVAPVLAKRAETWSFVAGPQWHAAFAGVPVSSDGVYRPLPGEALTVNLSRPEPLAGGSVAFDALELTAKVGERATTTDARLVARATRGGDHVIALPAGASLISAYRDDHRLALHAVGGKVALPLLPGSHQFKLEWRQPHGIGTVARVQAPDLGAPVANVIANLNLPPARWVLWAFGPFDGPAILYWAQLLLLVVVAWLLARFAPTPLRMWHWVLLGLGFSAFSWLAFAIVALWLILLGVRDRHPPSDKLDAAGFNLLQIGLALMTLIALLALVAAVPRGLLGLPDVHITGNGSIATRLSWFVDRSAGKLPDAGALSLPLWAYKVAILAWALWLANALIGWLRWGYHAWSRGGYWRRAPTPAAADNGSAGDAVTVTVDDAPPEPPADE